MRPPRLEFRTLGHAVQEVGERMVQFVLFPQQLALLQVACVYVCVCVCMCQCVCECVSV